MLLFLTFNGHLWLISLLADSFQTLPVSAEPLSADAFIGLVKGAGLIFLNGMMLALPLIILLLILFSPAGFWMLIQQLLIGAGIGLTMQLAFSAVKLAGEIIGLQMGLSFATLLDPNTRVNMPLLARFLGWLMVTLDSSQLIHWVAQFFWPMARLLALFASAPVLNERNIPKRVKVALAFVITWILLPLLPPVDVISATAGRDGKRAYHQYSAGGNAD
ncbi:hypothetical protein CRX72_20865 [Pantoea sp. BRM17]|nr:hypothetical protein CRX72_20865 [Pantoea sp. BRM17]